jgi:hypothetical protein
MRLSSLISLFFGISIFFDHVVRPPRPIYDLVSSHKPCVQTEKGEGIGLYDTPEAMLASEQLDGTLIGTRCSAEMALNVLPDRKPLFLEKPVAQIFLNNF